VFVDVVLANASPAAIVASFGAWAVGVGSRWVWDKTELTRALLRHRRWSRACAAMARESTGRPWVVSEPARHSAPCAGTTATGVPVETARVQAAHRVEGRPESASLAWSATGLLPPPLPETAGSAASQRALSAHLEEAAHGVRLQMRAADHIIEFLAHIRADKLGKHPVSGRWEAADNDRVWCKQYLVWARARSLMPLPEGVFLGLLSKAPGVLKSRDRMKDYNGRVMRNAHGTPLRQTRYTVIALAPSDSRSGSRPEAASGAQKRRAGGKSLEPIGMSGVMSDGDRARKLAELESEPQRVRRAA